MWCFITCTPLSLILSHTFSLSPSLCISLSLRLSLFPSLSVSLSCTRAHAHTHTYTLSLVFFFSFRLSHSFSLSLLLSLTYFLFLLCLSLFDAHMRAHTISDVLISKWKKRCNACMICHYLISDICASVAAHIVNLVTKRAVVTKCAATSFFVLLWFFCVVGCGLGGGFVVLF